MTDLVLAEDDGHVRYEHLLAGLFAGIHARERSVARHDRLDDGHVVAFWPSKDDPVADDRSAHRFARRLQEVSRWLGSLEVLPTIAALREHGEALVAQLLAENEGRWEALTERDRVRVEALARAAVNRLLHEPTMRVKALEGDQRHARLQLLRELFGLEEGAAAPEAAPAEVRRLRP